MNDERKAAPPAKIRRQVGARIAQVKRISIVSSIVVKKPYASCSSFFGA
jgi:hypothetical protein